jgi:hypothetical protein
MLMLTADAYRNAAYNDDVVSLMVVYRFLKRGQRSESDERQ